MRSIATVCVVIAIIGMLLGVIARIGPGMVIGQGARVWATGSGLFLLLAITLLLLEQKKQ